MKGAELALRKELVASCLKMNALGINRGTSGNASVRWRDGLLITPSGLDYEAMAPEDVVFMHMDGTYEGDLRPSSEWHFHVAILKARQDVAAVVHAHPTYATALSITRQDLPAAHYMIALAGGPTVRCADYATNGTEELAKNAVAALEGRLCCLLANHGIIACGDNLKRALWLADELETLARQYAISLQIGRPHILSNAEIARVIEKVKGYGRQPKPEPKRRTARGGKGKH